MIYKKEMINAVGHLIDAPKPLILIELKEYKKVKRGFVERIFSITPNKKYKYVEYEGLPPKGTTITQGGFIYVRQSDTHNIIKRISSRVAWDW